MVTDGRHEEADGARALRQSEERFRLLVESVTEYAIFMLDPAGHVETWNTGAERIKQYREDEIVGRHFSTFYTEEDREEGLPERLLEIAREQGDVEDTGWRVRKDGSRFWADVVITALHDDDGTLVGFAKVTRDMTDVRDFIGSIAHDLQTPVTAITGFTGIMLDEELPESESDELLRRIDANARLLEDLIEHLRTFSLLESGRVEVQPERLDLAAEARSVVAQMQPVLRGHTVSIDADGIIVSADRRGLRRILQNLLSNAARHSPAGTEVQIRAAVVDGTVQIEVEDEGQGIDDDLLPHLFERYRSGRGGGTGLGLSIVEQYVELHGGQVGVDTAEGEGATFWFTLPQG